MLRSGVSVRGPGQELEVRVRPGLLVSDTWLGLEGKG